MTGWLTYDQKQYDKNKWFADEILKYCLSFFNIELIIAEDLKFGTVDGSICFSVNGIKKRKPDFAICRTIFPFLSYVLENNYVMPYASFALKNVDG